MVTELAAAERLAGEWDELAVRASRAAGAPGWVLAWWRHVAGADAEARVVTLRDAGGLVGVAPFRLVPGRFGVCEHRLMADDFGVCMEPLALPGREWELAEAIAGALPEAALLRFGPMAIASHWVAALEGSWQGRVRPLVRRLRVEGAPVILLSEPSYEDWFATLSSKLRRDLRRSERLFGEAGGTIRWSRPDTLRADAEAFARLHAGRWQGRAWSRLSDLGERLPDWLEDLAGSLLGQGRMGLCVLEVQGEPVCVDLHIRAGGEALGVNVGWDERHARLAPAKLALLEVLKSAYAHGADRFALGNGNLSNKLRLANGNDPVAWTALVPPSPRYLQAYGSLLPELARLHAREGLTRALPEPWMERLQAARRADD